MLTRDPAWSAEGVLVAHSLEEALAHGRRLPGDVIVAGGAQVYAAALPVADEQLISEVDLEPEGDMFYPAFDRAELGRGRAGAHDGLRPGVAGQRAGSA